MSYPLRAVEKYLKAVARDMGLGDWNLWIQKDLLDNESSDDGVGTVSARCYVTFGRDEASVKLSKEFFGYDPAMQREIIVHELLHCHIDHMMKGVDPLEAQLNPAVFHLFYKDISERMEHTTDRIARALAPKFPLPNFNKKRKVREQVGAHPALPRI